MKLISTFTGLFFLGLCQETRSLTEIRTGNARSRRQFIDSIPAIGVASFFVLDAPSSTLAATTTDPAEAIRQTASLLPGYGPPDVYYPSSFQGTWKMHRQVVVGDDKSTTLDLDYFVRFLPSIQDNAVVADRAFNQANLENAISPDSVQTVDWNERNPNDLRMVFANGRTKDIKVTKRSTNERSETTVSSSEYQRVVVQDLMHGIPQITARRVLTKWKVAAANDGATTPMIQGLELVYDMGGGGDPLSLSSSQPSGQTLLSKSRLTLTRE